MHNANKFDIIQCQLHVEVLGDEGAKKNMPSHEGS
jgi:hypothetical protein